VPFFKSRPSKFVAISALCAAVASVLIAQTQLGILFQFNPVTMTYWIFLVLIVILYISIVEIAKKSFYKV
jgi:Mg2+-importing ATPase